MLSYYKGIPIAIVKGGELDSQIIYLDPKSKSIEQVERELDEEDEKTSNKPKHKLNGLQAVIYNRVMKGDLPKPESKR
jgi:hypothetical protein